MTEQVPGPPCSICGAEEAIGSLMQFGSWETTRFGPACAADYLRAVADAIDGAGTAEPEPDEPAREMLAAEVGPELAELSTPGPAVADDEPGSKEDHWASTQHVVRSTHGHRRDRQDREGDTP